MSEKHKPMLERIVSSKPARVALALGLALTSLFVIKDGKDQSLATDLRKWAFLPEIEDIQKKAPDFTQLTRELIANTVELQFERKVPGATVKDLCTGIGIGKKIVTAAHCLPSSHYSGGFTILDPENGDNLAKLAHINVVPGKDIAFGSNSGELNGLELTPNDTTPLKGSRFITYQLAHLDSNHPMKVTPVFGTMTYLGNFRGDSVFSVDSKLDGKSAKQFCTQGTSGSPIVDNVGHVEIFHASYNKDDFKSNMGEIGRGLGVSMVDVDPESICLANQLTSNMLKK